MDALTRQNILEETRGHVNAARSALAAQTQVVEQLPSGSFAQAEAHQQLANLKDLQSIFEARLEALEQSVDEGDPPQTTMAQGGYRQRRQSCILTSREREVLVWTAVGKTASEVGAIVGISPRTAEAYLRDAAKKLNAVNRIHAVVKALQLKLIVVGDI